MKDYNPTPIETSDVQLPRDLYTLMEELAKSNHDTWAMHRFEEGWSYGPNRDDISKKNPCLVPYDDLPEIEKEYDRNTSQETLKSIYKLGFSISKRTEGKVMLVGSYGTECVEEMKSKASKYELKIEYFQSWDFAKESLSKDLTKWHAIVLDWNAPLRRNEEATLLFLRDVVDDLYSIFHQFRNEVPWFIYPNTFDETYTSTVIKFTVGRERINKDWGELVYQKGNVDLLFKNISELLPNTRNYRIRNVYDEVFLTLEEVNFSVMVKNMLFNILLPLHYPEIFHSFVPTDYFNNLRRIVESIFGVMNNYCLIPDDICYSHDYDNAINLRYCSNYLLYGEGKSFCPNSVSQILKNILDTANEGSHIGSEYKTRGLYYSIMGFSLQLCDVIVWLGKHIKTNNCVSLNEEKGDYVNQIVPISKDEEGNYYYGKCIFPSQDFVATAFDNNQQALIVTIFENKAKTRCFYPFRAKIRIVEDK
jgi:ryanodine receptor 2